MASPLTGIGPGVRQPCTRPRHGARAAGSDARNGERAVVETGTVCVDAYRAGPPAEYRCRRRFLSRPRRETRPCCPHMLRKHAKIRTGGMAEAAVSFWAGRERNGRGSSVWRRDFILNANHIRGTIGVSLEATVEHRQLLSHLEYFPGRSPHP
jgi:hypothetical protein